MDNEERSIEILKTFQGKEPYILAHSGGKDSDVLLHLAKKAGVDFRAVHNLTTVDAPETVQYVKRKGIEIHKSKTMWDLIVENLMPPTRLVRYCCEELKESYGSGHRTLTGVRKAESRNRANNQGDVTIPRPDKKLKSIVDGEAMHITVKGGMILNYDDASSRQIVEDCYRTYKTMVNPIVDWDDDYLWWYIRHEDIEINPLYGKGFCRIGCIGCPMAGKDRWTQFRLYPTYQRAYIRAFDKMVEARKAKGLTCKGWETGQKVFDWWMEDKNVDGQYSFDFDSDNIAVGFREKGK